MHVPAEGDVPGVLWDVLIDVAVTIDLDQVEFSLRSPVFPLFLDRLAKLREEVGQSVVACETEVLVAKQVSDRRNRLDVVADVPRADPRLVVAEDTEVALARSSWKWFEVLSSREPVAHAVEFVTHGRIGVVTHPVETSFDQSPDLVEGIDAESRFGGAQHCLRTPLVGLPRFVRTLQKRQCLVSERVDRGRVVLLGGGDDDLPVFDLLELCPCDLGVR